MYRTGIFPQSLENLFPRQAYDLASFNFIDTSLDFLLPGDFDVPVRFCIETRNQALRYGSPVLRGHLHGLRQNIFNCCAHDFISLI
jgi:hypothetical protein